MHTPMWEVELEHKSGRYVYCVVQADSASDASDLAERYYPDLPVSGSVRMLDTSDAIRVS